MTDEHAQDAAAAAAAAAAESFWQPTEDLDEAPPVPAETPSALERLGPSPFPKSGFPFLGFLATVYDQVATHVAGPAGVSQLAP